MTPSTGQLWTRSRLVRLLAARFGPGTHSSEVDTAAVAQALGVSRRSVQRWLHTSSGRSLARIPEARLEQLLVLVRPSPELLAAEQVQARYAEKAIANLGLARGRGILPAWRKQRWIEPHVVLVRELTWRGVRVRQLSVVRADRRDELLRSGGRLIDQVEVPSKFHATAVAQHALGQVGLWRIHATKDQAPVGMTQVWTRDAPGTQLEGWAAQLQQERDALVSHRRRGSSIPADDSASAIQE